MKIQLGDEVVDVVTKWKGVVIGITEYINGCVQYGVKPEMGKDGKMPEAHWIDERQLKITKKQVVAVKSVRTGGPMEHPRGMSF